MKPIKFKGSNVVFGKDQDEYQPLPAFKNESPQGEVITCWELTFNERIRVLFTGKIWMSIMSFNKPLTPSIITTKMSDVLEFEEPTDKVETIK